MMLGTMRGSPTDVWKLGPQRSWTHNAAAILKRRVERLLIGDSCIAPIGYAPVVIERVGKRAYAIRHGKDRVSLGKGKGRLKEVVAAVLNHPMLKADWSPPGQSSKQLLLPLHD